MNKVTATFTAPTAEDLRGFMSGVSLKHASIKRVRGLSVIATWIGEAGEELDTIQTLQDEVSPRDLELYAIDFSI